MKKKTILLSLLISALITVNAFASFSIEGALKSTRANESVNINPWNVASFQGVGEGNIFDLYTPDGKVEIPLDYPLYRLSSGYTDKITCKEGKWGIERNVGIKTFDGSENWSLLKKTTFLNSNTSVFTCDFGENAPDILSGWCSHFDVYKFSTIKSTTYDGISFGENSDTVILRIMNVRNVKTVDELKKYLKTQYDNGNPVRLFYCLNEPEFTQFDDSLQKELNSISPGNVGYTDKNCIGIKFDSDNINTSLFAAASSKNEYMDNFLSAVSDVKVYNCDVDKKFYVSGITKDRNGITFTIKDENKDIYTSYLPYSKADFIAEKPTELIFKGNEKEIIKMQVYLNRMYVPKDNISGFSYDLTGINSECIMEKDAVIPKKVTAITGTELDFTNALLNSSLNYGDDIELFDSKHNQVTKNGKLKVTEEGEETYSVYLNGKNVGYTTVYAYDNNKNLDGKTVMFLGDSLINQNLYSQYFKELAGNVNLIGNLGTKDNRNEGRGGWSAYDYCNETTKYGFTNPFLNNGKFDFSYYMKNNKFKSPDYVIIDLGINDLNLKNHNTHSEILSYFDEIEKSIHSYNKDIKIIFNTPLMLFDTVTTNTAKNTRLEFVQSLYNRYINTENVYVSPIFFNVDCYTDFKFEENTIDEYNQDSAMTVTDTTHPNNGGYLNIAKATLSFIYSID
ncbi:MAG: SGNH/GDSL hydrolase family protein [Clostridia bacterium]|jgi:lysophospholipase L1-like esterase|nr:SGNH/GDSL hydrolase family protein [Clostridia bacterium]